MSPKVILLCSLCLAPSVSGQDQLKDILERLDKLEQENRALRKEVQRLDLELHGQNAQAAAATALKPLEERVEVQESRTAELAQTKLEASSRFPISVTGMALFNTFYNTGGNGGTQYPTTASLTGSPANGGGTLRQSIIGVRFEGPTIAGGKVSGSLYTDFWGGTDSSLNHLLRIRTAAIQVDWKNTTIMAGQDKPLISPREPTSIAQVAVSPLTGAGNPWLWQPQVRVERRFALNDSAGFRAQGALFQTSESRTTLPDGYDATIDPARPGYQGRFEIWKDFRTGARVEVASGFHLSTSRVDHYRVPSRIYSLDWMIRPVASLEFSGLFFNGQNIAPLGALRQGFVLAGGDPQAVRTRGGYGQLTWRTTSRLSFNAFTGQQDDRNADLLPGRIGKNLIYGANAMYHLVPNVIISFEGSEIKTTFIGTGVRRVTHYDLGLAYLF